ncbi:LOW QUALITY PROTEIN: membrane protein [Geomicrobium sp. JCM 19039]|nr:LOW QUALITY PROTEIN: membrane protein [Geomicrobium sp. JCM 19039]
MFTNRDYKLLLITGGLYAMSTALSNTFVNVYLWKQTEDLMMIALYQLASVLFQPLAFFLAGRLTKQMDRTIVLRIGVIVLSLFYLTVLLLGQNASQMIVVVGALLGLGFGIYWLAFNVLTFEITEPGTRDSFNGFLGLFTSLAGIGPFTAGLVIQWFPGFTGYRTIFFISLLLFAVAVWLSFRFKKRSSPGIFRISSVWQRRHVDDDWRRILFAHFFQGLREGVFVFVIVIWVYMSTGSELALGTYGWVTSSVSFVFYFLAGKYLKTKYRKRAILTGAIMLYGALFLILPDRTFVTLIIYGIIISMAYPLIFVPYVSMTYDIIGKAYKAASMRVEYLIMREWFTNAGRAGSIICFMVVVNAIGQAKGVPLVMLIFGAGHLFLYFCIRPIQIWSTSNKDQDYNSERLEDANRQT